MSQPGTLWHTIRGADGGWQPSFGFVEGQEANNPGQFTAAGCAGVGNELQLAGVAGFTGVWHTIRHPDGTWQNAFGNVGNEIQQGFASIDCGGVGSDMHLVVIPGLANGGPIWHTIRHPDGTWQPGFGVVGGLFTRVACAGVGDELQVVGLTGGGQLWHTIRHPDGTWQPQFGLVESQEANNPGRFTAVACAGVDGELQLVGIAGGQLWHTIRHADGSWQPSFGLVESQEANNPGAFTAIGCAGVSNELQLIAVDAGGRLWHTIRHADGGWQPSFGLVESQEANDPGPFADVSCGAVENQLQLVARTPQTIGFL